MHFVLIRVSFGIITTYKLPYKYYVFSPQSTYLREKSIKGMKLISYQRT